MSERKVFGRIILLQLVALILLSFFSFDLFKEDHYYGKYAISVIEDGDLNLANQVSDDERWVVTPSYYQPSYISNTYSTFAYPVYLYQNFLLKKIPILNNKSSYRMAGVFTNLIYFSLTILLMIKISQIQKVKNNILILCLVTIATSLLFHIVHALSSPNIVAAFAFSLMLIFYILWRSKAYERKYGGWSFGLGCTVGLVYPFAPFFSIFALIVIIVTEYQMKLDGFLLRSKGVYVPFIIGALLTVCLNKISEVQKFGQLFDYSLILKEYFAPNFSIFLKNLWRNLFGYSSINFSTPIYMTVLIYGALRSKLRMKSAVDGFAVATVILGVVYFIIKSISIFYGEPNFASEHALMVAPLIYLYAGKFYQEGRSRIMIFLLLVCASIQLYYFLSYISVDYSIPLHYDLNKYWMMSSKTISLNMIELYFTNRLISFKEQLGSHAIYFLMYFPLVLIFSFVFTKIFLNRNIKPIFLFFSCYIVLAYLSFVGLDYLNGKKNVIAMKEQGLYSNSVVSENMSLLVYDEVIDIYQIGINATPSFDDVKAIESSRNHYIKKLAKGILYDPIGLLDDLSMGKIRNSYWLKK